MRATRDLQKAETRAAITSALAALAELPGRKGYPSAERIVAQGAGGFSRSRVFENMDLVDAALAAWKEREQSEGRSINPRRRRRATATSEPAERGSAAKPTAEVDDRISRALKLAKDNGRRVKRLTKDNEDLRRKLQRAAKGVHDEIWPTRECETAGFPGDPLDEDE